MDADRRTTIARRRCLEDCREALRLNESEGLGAATIAELLGVVDALGRTGTRTVDAMIERARRVRGW